MPPASGLRSRMGSQVHNGWVTLTGAVEDAYERREAEAAVRTLDGVVGVTNLIETRTSTAAPILGGGSRRCPIGLLGLRRRRSGSLPITARGYARERTRSSIGSV